MDGDQTHFNGLLIEAHRATVALDGVAKKDGARAFAEAVNNGKRIHALLLEYQKTAWMTKPEAAAVQHALDLLEARLKFFGESV
jgi:hypothetical protein